ncbi:PREDICTED: cytochrome P450 4V2-like [Rhagoletis zephyria]|uniref:cytochrome P450 4V2-like n=1 Tax=Rhagoletis zephyria TaxID=28612 RepID=UPI0008115A8B|nr:PREDICTED: cytochrome P450 4V2-like [Rhagoletis zephyria]
MLTSVNKIYKGEGICKMWIGMKPLVMLYRPDDVEVILSSSTLTQKSVEYHFLDNWLGEGLVTSSRAKWRLRRKILTPAFHFRILEDFLPIINEQSNVLVAKLGDQCDQNGDQSPPPIGESTTTTTSSAPFDVVPVITLCMLDIICETAMGVKLNLQANSNHEYVESLYNISRIFLIRLMRPWLWPTITFNLSEHGRIFNRSVQNTKDFTMKVIKERRDEWVQCLEEDVNGQPGNMSGNVDNLDAIKSSTFFAKKKGAGTGSSSSTRLAFLDLLLQHHLVTKKLSLEDLREEVDTFMFAGHDTTSHAISWTLYMLGLYPEVQAKAAEEVDHLVEMEGADISDLTVENLKSLKYLECVLKEVQRIYPTAPFIGRELSEDTKINNYLVPKGTTVGIFTYVLHRDPIAYPQPERFLPERFLPENVNGRHPYSFIPFSAGPRNCIGQKFAMMEMKMVIAKILRHYHLQSVQPRDQLVIVGEMILRSLNGLKMVFSRRTQVQR